MGMKLKDHMSRHLITIDQTETAKEAQRLMSNYWIRHLPVIDPETGHVVGLLSDRDLLRSPSLDIPTEQLMSTPFKSFDIETPLVDIVEAMIDEKISAFVITQDDDVVGLVTSEDLLAVLAQILREDANKTWALNEILTNPALQRTAYILGQTGI